MRLRLAVLLLVLVGFITYFNIIRNQFIADDFPQIVDNSQIASLKNIPGFFFESTFYNGGNTQLAGSNYRPIMMTAYTLIHSIAGLNQKMYHLFQLLLFIGNSLLLFFILRYFFSTTNSFILALFFLVHPINNETVVYIADLGDILFLFFGFSALLVTLQSKKFTIKTLIGVALLLLLSLFSKETGLVFIPLLCTYAYLFKKQLFRKIMALGGITILIYITVRTLAHFAFENVAIAPIAQASLLTRIINIPAICLYYLKMFFFPAHIEIFQFWIIKQVDFLHVYLPLLALCFFAFLAVLYGIWIYKSGKKQFNLYIFFLLWTLLGLIPHLQIIPLDVTVADRWFYFSSAGMLGILGTVIGTIEKVKGRTKTVGIAIFIVVAILLISRSIIRNINWKNETILYSHDLAEDKNNFYIENSLATLLINDRKFKEAEPLVSHSVSVYPFPANLNNLAIVYEEEGKVAKAGGVWKKILLVDKNYVTYENYANFLLVLEKNPKEARDFVKKVLPLYPNDAKLWVILAKSELLLGNREAGLKDIAKAEALLPHQYIQQVKKILNNSHL